MAKFESYTNYNDRAASLLTKMFFWRFFISTILPLLRSSKVIWVNNNLEGYDDFTPNWYLIEGSNILIGMYARCLIIIWVFMTRYYYPLLTRAYDQKFKGSMMITRSTTHKGYVAVYKNFIFDVYLSYAEIMNIIFMAFTLGFILPHIFIPSLIMLIFIFYKDKILGKKKLHFSIFPKFQKFSKNFNFFSSAHYLQDKIPIRSYTV